LQALIIKGRRFGLAEGNLEFIAYFSACLRKTDRARLPVVFRLEIVQDMGVGLEEIDPEESEHQQDAEVFSV